MAPGAVAFSAVRENPMISPKPRRLPGTNQVRTMHRFGASMRRSGSAIPETMIRLKKLAVLLDFPRQPDRAHTVPSKTSTNAPVAQLDRALASGARGQRFESSRAYQPFNHLRALTSSIRVQLCSKLHKVFGLVLLLLLSRLRESPAYRYSWSFRHQSVSTAFERLSPCRAFGTELQRFFAGTEM